MNTAGLGRLLFSARRRLGVFRDVRTLKKRIRGAAPLRIVVGAGGLFDPGWIPTDVDVLDILDEGHWHRLFRENSIDAILAEHVWEHLTADQGLLAAENCFRFLGPGGYLRAAVPDGYHPDPAYREWVRPGGSGAGADDLTSCSTTTSRFGSSLHRPAFRSNRSNTSTPTGNFTPSIGTRHWARSSGPVVLTSAIATGSWRILR